MIFFDFFGTFNTGVLNSYAHETRKFNFSLTSNAISISKLETDRRAYEKQGYLPAFRNNDVARAFVSSIPTNSVSAGLRIPTQSEFSCEVVVNASAIGVVYPSASIDVTPNITANAMLQAHVYAFVNANVVVPEQTLRRAIREEVFLTPTNAIAQYAQLNNLALYLNSLFGVVAQSVHKTEITGNNLRIYDHSGNSVYFQRVLTFDQNLLPVRNID